MPSLKCLNSLFSWVNSPNSGCLLNIGNGPQSGTPLHSKAKGRDAAHQFIMGPKAATWLIIVQRDLCPVFGKHPEFGEFTQPTGKLCD